MKEYTKDSLTGFENSLTDILENAIQSDVAYHEKVQSALDRAARSIRIHYHLPELHRLEYIDGKSDWIDLRAAERVHLKTGDFRLISLGVSMKLPDGYEAIIAPRSSTFKRYGLIQTNGIGLIDCSFCGDDDIWQMPVYATRETTVQVNDRICQFRIQKNQPKINFLEVNHLDGVTRGGFGSTGAQ